MYAEERKREIADRMRHVGRVDVGDLAERFDVTPETIRRDLTDLESERVLQRVHGGAIPVERFRGEPAMKEKAATMAAEKQRIARAAAAFVPDAGSVLLDAGTTTLALASVFPDRELTVFTHSMPVGLELASRPKLQLYLVGGRVRARTLAHVGDWALQRYADLQVDVAFVATNGMSLERGLSTPDPAEAAVKRAICQAARQVVVLADHSKVGQEHAVRFAEISDVDVFVTDSGLSTEHVTTFERANIEVIAA